MAVPHPHRTPFAFRNSLVALTLAQSALGYAADGQTTTLITAIKLAEAREAGTASRAELSCAEQPCVYDIAIERSDHTVVQVRIPVNSKMLLAESAPGTEKLGAPAPAPSAITPADTGFTNRKVELKLGAGQIAGMGNAILHPVLTLGMGGDFHLRDFPQVDTDFNASLIVGKTESTQNTSRPGLQEIRGSAHSIYNFYNDRGISKAGVGLYVDFAQALRHHRGMCHRTPAASTPLKKTSPSSINSTWDLTFEFPSTTTGWHPICTMSSSCPETESVPIC
ncbi:hypothetical protein [Aquabacterium sp. CECT 9606]|uniref:hypothetical protein n=1 Tax=Aquabacterium sp. CECT 9606 TaxID=2845822 RepID=UPI001E5065CB|nr:hypothetical protein [Aquabacterium sp. CECT 9606]